jgi:hypothetical protein
MLVGRWQEEPREGGEIDPAMIARIGVHASLASLASSMTTSEDELGVTSIQPWRVDVRIPFNLLQELHGPPGGLPRPIGDAPPWRCNFFKCADSSSHPHWAAWSPIGEKLWFHQTKFFGELRFGS